MKIATVAEAQAMAVRRLGLDERAIDLTSVEALAASLRRAAGFLCPCGPSTLRRAVARALDGLFLDTEQLRTSIESTLDAMIGFGDLIEQRELNADGRAANLLYPAYPSFVLTGDGTVMIVGISPEHTSPLTEDLEDRIEYANHLRRLRLEPAEDIRSALKALGLFELTFETWLKMPPRLTIERTIARFDDLLDVAAPSGDIPELTVMESTRPVRYYRGRWTGADGLTGRYVGRRPQAYGADLWCYVELRSGTPVRFVGVPLRAIVYAVATNMASPDGDRRVAESHRSSASGTDQRSRASPSSSHPCRCGRNARWTLPAADVERRMSSHAYASAISKLKC